MLHEISVAIPTCNLQGTLNATIESIVRQQATVSFEVLVLDNGSGPCLADIVERIATWASVPVRYFWVPSPGLHHGRHAGAQHAQSEILVYVDDDVVAAPGWLQAIASAFQDEAVQLVGGRSLPDFALEPPAWLQGFWSHSRDRQQICGYLSLIDLGDEPHVIDPNLIWGLNFAIRKQTLAKLGGFNPDGMPWELRKYRGDGESAVTRKAKALGLKAIYHPDALVYHHIPQSRLTIEYFERRAFLQGISDSFTRIRHAGRIEPLPQLAHGTTLGRESVSQIIRRLSCYVRHPVQHGRNFVRRRFARALGASAERSIDDEVAVVKARSQQAYRAGYTFHCDAVAENPELLAWVLREDYWLP